MITELEFRRAYDNLKKFVKQTPLIYSDWLSKELNGSVYLKLECFNPGNSFKIRGAVNSILEEEKLPEKIITASGGNHGLGVVIACNLFNLQCTVVLPKSTSQFRVDLLKNLGADVIIFGDAWDEANEYATSLVEEGVSKYIHAFADKSVMMGQGTIIPEIESQIDLSNVDIFVASIGGGGLLAGNSLAIEKLGYDIEIIGVETKGADTIALSLKEDKLIKLENIDSIAKTLGAKTTTQEIFSIMKEHVSQMIVVEDKAAVEALFRFLKTEKILIEPATSCLIAAALENKDLFKNKTSIFVICGSNVSIDEAMNWKEEFGVLL